MSICIKESTILVRDALFRTQTWVKTKSQVMDADDRQTHDIVQSVLKWSPVSKCMHADPVQIVREVDARAAERAVPRNELDVLYTGVICINSTNSASRSIFVFPSAVPEKRPVMPRHLFFSSGQRFASDHSLASLVPRGFDNSGRTAPEWVRVVARVCPAALRHIMPKRIPRAPPMVGRPVSQGRYIMCETTASFISFDGETHIQSAVENSFPAYAVWRGGFNPFGDAVPFSFVHNPWPSSTQGDDEAAAGTNWWSDADRAGTCGWGGFKVPASGAALYAAFARRDVPTALRSCGITRTPTLIRATTRSSIPNARFFMHLETVRSVSAVGAPAPMDTSSALWFVRERLSPAVSVRAAASRQKELCIPLVSPCSCCGSPHATGGAKYVSCPDCGNLQSRADHFIDTAMREPGAGVATRNIPLCTESVKTAEHDVLTREYLEQDRVKHMMYPGDNARRSADGAMFAGAGAFSAVYAQVFERSAHAERGDVYGTIGSTYVDARCVHPSSASALSEAMLLQQMANEEVRGVSAHATDYRIVGDLVDGGLAPSVVFWQYLDPLTPGGAPRIRFRSRAEQRNRTYTDQVLGGDWDNELCSDPEIAAHLGIPYGRRCSPSYVRVCSIVRGEPDVASKCGMNAMFMPEDDIEELAFEWGYDLERLERAAEFIARRAKETSQGRMARLQAEELRTIPRILVHMLTTPDASEEHRLSFPEPNEVENIEKPVLHMIKTLSKMIRDIGGVPTPTEETSRRRRRPDAEEDSEGETSHAKVHRSVASPSPTRTGVHTPASHSSSVRPFRISLDVFSPTCSGAGGAAGMSPPPSPVKPRVLHATAEGRRAPPSDADGVYDMIQRMGQSHACFKPNAKYKTGHYGSFFLPVVQRGVSIITDGAGGVVMFERRPGRDTVQDTTDDESMPRPEPRPRKGAAAAKTGGADPRLKKRADHTERVMFLGDPSGKAYARHTFAMYFQSWAYNSGRVLRYHPVAWGHIAHARAEFEANARCTGESMRTVANACLARHALEASIVSVDLINGIVTWSGKDAEQAASTVVSGLEELAKEYSREWYGQLQATIDKIKRAGRSTPDQSQPSTLFAVSKLDMKKRGAFFKYIEAMLYKLEAAQMNSCGPWTGCTHAILRPKYLARELSLMHTMSFSAGVSIVDNFGTMGWAFHVLQGYHPERPYTTSWLRHVTGSGKNPGLHADWTPESVRSQIPRPPPPSFTPTRDRTDSVENEDIPFSNLRVVNDPLTPLIDRAPIGSSIDFALNDRSNLVSPPTHEQACAMTRIDDSVPTPCADVPHDERRAFSYAARTPSALPLFGAQCQRFWLPACDDEWDGGARKPSGHEDRHKYSRSTLSQEVIHLPWITHVTYPALRGVDVRVRKCWKRLKYAHDVKCPITYLSKVSMYRGMSMVTAGCPGAEGIPMEPCESGVSRFVRRLFDVNDKEPRSLSQLEDAGRDAYIHHVDRITEEISTRAADAAEASTRRTDHDGAVEAVAEAVQTIFSSSGSGLAPDTNYRNCGTQFVISNSLASNLDVCFMSHPSFRFGVPFLHTDSLCLALNSRCPAYEVKDTFVYAADSPSSAPVSRRAASRYLNRVASITPYWGTTNRPKNGAGPFLDCTVSYLPEFFCDVYLYPAGLGRPDAVVELQGGENVPPPRRPTGLWCGRGYLLQNDPGLADPAGRGAAIAAVLMGGRGKELPPQVHPFAPDHGLDQYTVVTQKKRKPHTLPTIAYTGMSPTWNQRMMMLEKEATMYEMVESSVTASRSRQFNAFARAARLASQETEDALFHTRGFAAFMVHAPTGWAISSFFSPGTESDSMSSEYRAAVLSMSTGSHITMVTPRSGGDSPSVVYPPRSAHVMAAVDTEFLRRKCPQILRLHEQTSAAEEVQEAELRSRAVADIRKCVTVVSRGRTVGAHSAAHSWFHKLAMYTLPLECYPDQAYCAKINAVDTIAVNTLGEDTSVVGDELFELVSKLWPSSLYIPYDRRYLAEAFLATFDVLCGGSTDMKLGHAVSAIVEAFACAMYPAVRSVCSGVQLVIQPDVDPVQRLAAMVDALVSSTSRHGPVVRVALHHTITSFLDDYTRGRLDAIVALRLYSSSCGFESVRPADVDDRWFSTDDDAVLKPGSEFDVCNAEEGMRKMGERFDAVCRSYYNTLQEHCFEQCTTTLHA